MCSRIPLVPSFFKKRKYRLRNQIKKLRGVVGSQNSEEKKSELLTAQQHAGTLTRYKPRKNWKFGNAVRDEIWTVLTGLPNRLL